MARKESEPWPFCVLPMGRFISAIIISMWESRSFPDYPSPKTYRIFCVNLEDGRNHETRYYTTVLLHTYESGIVSRYA